VAALLGGLSDRIHLFGYSAGGQFAHRFALAYPERIAKLAVGAAGRYTFPDPEQRYPRGLRKAETRLGRPIDLEAFLRLPIRVWVGAEDIEQDDRLTRNEKVMEQQGPDRLARAQRWVDAVAQAAAGRGIESGIALEVVPQAAHSFTQCSRRGMTAAVTGFFFGPLFIGGHTATE
jgi:pimeloyl-ACP methyl ester carboxylesterase